MLMAHVMILCSVSRANTEKEGSITEAGHTPPQEDPALTAAEGEGNPLASSSDHNPERSEIPAQHHQGDQKEEGKKQRKRKYVLKGGASALAVQLFGIDDAFEMRLVTLWLVHQQVHVHSLYSFMFQVHRLLARGLPALPSEFAFSIAINCSSITI